MSEKYYLRWPFNSQHGKRAQTLLKTEQRHLYHIYWSLWKQLSLENSLFVICIILGLFAYTLTGNDKYSLPNRGNLTQPTQMQLSYKQKTFSEVFSAVLKSRLTFDHFQEKGDPPSWWISELTDFEKGG